MVKEQFYQEAKKPTAMHPKKFALWLFQVSVVMIFAALTSYFIAGKNEGSFWTIKMPFYFWVNTATIILSSITMHWAYLMAKANNFQKLKLALLITTVLGAFFLVGQYFAWQDLFFNGIVFAGRTSNAAGSLIYVLSGLHGVHLIGGIIFLVVVLFNSFNFKIHSKNMVQMEMCATYWHFLDGLWVYLFVFLLLNN